MQSKNNKSNYFGLNEIREVYKNKNTNLETPLVSVQVITYMHEEFISDCLNGILNQRTDFPVEIIINDDASIDGTQSIIMNFQKKYPSLIKTIFQETNQYSISGFKNIKKQINDITLGKYIALCEGDDYWIDPYKLQKQVDFLQNNLEFSMCFHNSSESYNGKLSSMPFVTLNKNVFTVKDFLYSHIVPTASMVYKNNIKLPDWHYKINSGDKLIIFLCAFTGPIYFMDEIMSHYRVNDNGASRSEDHRGINKIYNMSFLYAHLNTYTDFKYEDVFKKGLEYEIGVHALDPYRKELKTKLLIKEIIIRICIKFFNYKRKS